MVLLTRSKLIFKFVYFLNFLLSSFPPSLFLSRRLHWGLIRPEFPECPRNFQTNKEHYLNVLELSFLLIQNRMKSGSNRLKSKFYNRKFEKVSVLCDAQALGEIITKPY